MGLILQQLWVFVVMILLLEGEWCNGCLEDERIALLNLKAYLNYPNGREMHSWGKIPNCCLWEYVKCDSITGRVTSLYPLRDWRMEDWYLNASFFLPFKELKLLDLNSMNIWGCVENEGFERLSSLPNLEFLNLGDNKFNNSILPSLSGLSSLKYLKLIGNRLKGTINSQELNLTSLKGLYLSRNQIEGFEFSHGLSNLKVLDLSLNEIIKFQASSGQSNLKVQHKGLSSLESLNLRYNSLKGTIDMKELDLLSNLKELDLSGNEIIKFQVSRESHNLNNLEELFLDSCSLDENFLQSRRALPSLKLLSLISSNISSQGFPNFKNLEHLYLNYSNSDSNILPVVANFTSLKTLSLPNCELSGSIPVDICELKHLQFLDMSNNDPKDTLPWCLANLTSLRQLDLSYNHFIGKISLLGVLSSIQELWLSENHFQIPISLSPLFNNTELKYFDGQDNEFYQEIEENNLIPKFQLEILVLSGLRYIGTFPKFLYYQHNLKFVALCSNKMEGGFPFWLLENNTKLEDLFLVNNSLSGPLQFPIHNHTSLIELDISNNGFHGHIPMGIGASFPMLQSLIISRNNFSGNILDFFCNVSSLQYLQMDGNNFTGNIPDSLSECSLDLLDISDNHLSGMIPGWMRNMTFLRILNLSKNNIYGSLPPNFNPPLLVSIYLSKNRIHGSIAYAFFNCSDLRTLDLGHNFLTGAIPKWLGSLSSLGYLSLGHNNLEGEIPNQLCNLDLKLIDLSHNNLSGHIPSCIKYSGWVDGTFGRHPLDFTIKWVTYSYQKSILCFLYGIDLSYNKLSGEIPPEIGILSMIRVLNLSHNNLTGKIPSTFSNLSEIEILDLSYNNLDGKIPPQLTQLHKLSFFSVAHNNLSGRTPEIVAQFATFEKNSYEENPFLCGLPLEKSCTEAISPSSMPRVSTNDEEENGVIDMDIFYISFTVAYIIIFLAIIAVLWINLYWRRAWFYFIEICITNFKYFLEDNVYVLFKITF